MKVSIITVCYNSAKTIEKTIQSVISQTHPDIEYIIIDGLSSDQTLQIIEQYREGISILVSEKDKGMYNAMNKGITLATGDIVGILNSDDFFSSDTSVADIVSAFEENNSEAVFGDIAFVSPTDLQKKIRHYSSRSFSIKSFQYGFMPPHPTFYVKRSCYQTFGLYQEDYVIASDYELIMRFLYTHRISYSYIPRELVYMRPGGVSNQTLYSRFLLNKEIIRACNENGVRTGYLLLSLKYFKKSTEYIQPFILNIFSRKKA
eukprot:Opistho-1_new@66194